MTQIDFPSDVGADVADLGCAHLVTSPTVRNVQSLSELSDVEWSTPLTEDNTSSFETNRSLMG